ncbi:MAG: DUF2878 domain-containing protein [Woeseiaceae bacterium]
MIINLSFFKAAWLASVLTAAASMPVLGTAAVAIAVIVHLRRAENVQGEVRLLFLAALMGLLWESALVSFGLVEYTASSILPGSAPYWIVAMWVLFATTLNVGMRWLQKSTWVAAVAGAVGGPMSFLAGQKAGAVSFPDQTLAIVAISLGWAVLLPLLVRFASRSAIDPTMVAQR